MSSPELKLDNGIDDELSRTLENWLNSIEGRNRAAVDLFLADPGNSERIATAPGSRDAHHAWPGGYREHVRQTMMIASHNFRLFTSMERMQELPQDEQFSLSDALTVMFLHDIEKPFIYGIGQQGEVVKTQSMPKAERKAFRQAVIDKYGFDITPTMANALKYVEGVRDEDYVPGERADQPLAALCHAADNLSARGLYDHR